MLTEEVKRRPALDRFIYWIKERQSIYLKKQAGQLPPWTDDEILQTVFFTNPFRENDKTTVWFRNRIREPLRDNPKVLFATVCFRWFNLINTGEVLIENRLLANWNEDAAVAILRELKPVFTGAFMIKCGNGPPGCKVPQVCSALTQVWNARKSLLAICDDHPTLEALWLSLKRFRGLGGFMAYEIVTDLRHTYLLEDATDINTWTNIGPGATRGLARVNGTPIKLAKGGMKDSNRKPPKDGVEQLVRLLYVVRRRIPSMKFELRDIEHSLCEFFKYEREAFKLGGHTKRCYKGGT